MSRLTENIRGQWYISLPDPKNEEDEWALIKVRDKYRFRGPAVDKLAKYEDTLLDPNDIEECKSLFVAYKGCRTGLLRYLSCVLDNQQMNGSNEADKENKSDSDMTIDEAIDILENGDWWSALDDWYHENSKAYDKLYEAVALARSVLHQQAEKESSDNKPLTYHDLRDMDGEPVWVEMRYAYTEALRSYYSGWAFVDVLPGSQGNKDKIRLMYNNGAVNPLGAIQAAGGKIYRSKLCESHHATSKCE